MNDKNIIKISGDVKFPAAWIEREHEGVSKRKKGSEITAFTYQKTNLPDRDKKAFKLRVCGKTLVYSENPIGGEPIPVSAMRCGLRLCPSCSWIRAHKIFQNVYSIITDGAFSQKQFIFLTLTIKNCRGEFLESEIKRILSAWNVLTSNERQPFRRSFLGTFRALEVTYNPLKKTYHPHLHAMAAVEPDYFKKSNKHYISQTELRELWRDACDLNYLPQCHIEKVKNATGKQVAEVAKYTLKTADYLNRPDVVQVLDPALHRKRLVAYGGLFKTVKARLLLPDDDLDELPKMTVEELLRNPYIRKIIFEWDMGAYRVREYQPSSNLAEWLKPERIIAEDFRRQAKSWGQGV